MTMAWTDARDFTEAILRIERERVVATAVAARAAQCGEKAWEEWVANMSKGR